MYISRLQATCSMVELCSVSAEDILESTKKKFLNKIYDDIEDEELDIGVVIYNTTHSAPKILKKLEDFGFKEVFAYNGNDNVVRTFMLNIRDKN